MKQSLLIGGLLLILSCTDGQTLNEEIIINKAIEAYGGERNLNNIQTKREVGTSIIYMNDSIFRTSHYLNMSKKGGKFYYESPLNKGKYFRKLVFASNGEYSWTQNDGAMAPYMQPQEEHQNKDGEDYPYFFTMEERGITTSFRGSSNENSEVLYRIDYVDQDGKVEEVYFEAAGWKIRKIRKEINTSQGVAENIIYFNDYRLVNGISIPFRTDSHYPPSEIDSYILQEVMVNEPLDDSLFEFPEPYQFTDEEIENLMGQYSSKENNERLQISSDRGVMIVKYNGQSVKPIIVNAELFMFRNGEGFGSRIINVFINQHGGESISLHLKDKTIVLDKG